MPCYIRPKVDEKKIKEGTISMKQKKLLKSILIADRKDTTFPDSVRKSQGQKAKPKLMNART